MLGLNATSILGAALPASIKQPATTGTIPNPLNKYASYSYAWSLWWVGLEDFNRLMTCTDVDQALAWEPGPWSYVVAEDSGLYPDRRIPGILPVNYNIQDVNFETIIAPNKQSRSSNMISGSMTIIEPYGVTFIDSLIVASFDGTKYTNYTGQPYMLQLEFFGYDDNGDPIPKSELTTYRKRFPIRLLEVGVEVSGSQGAVYKIGFCPMGHLGHHPEKATLPKDVTITAETVGEFFYILEATLNGFYQIDAYVKGNAAFADSIHFDINADIAKSSIVYDKSGVPLPKGNPAASGFDLSKGNFNIKAGTSLLAIVDRVMAQSAFLIRQLKGTGDSDATIQTNVFSAYKTMAKAKFSGIDQSGTPHDNVYDPIRNTLPVAMTYTISQYPSWKGESPHTGIFPDSTPYTSKKYNYLYTGQNTDVIDFKLQFDTTYYTAVLGYTTAVSSTQSSPNTKNDSLLNFKRNFSLNPALLVNNVPNISPSRYRYILGDGSLTHGGGLLNSPKAQKAADVIKSIYSGLGGDMINLDLTIIGDPSLIKQDDWLYIPSPTTGTKYNSWDSQSQSDFFGRYGHIRMDSGEVVVQVTINSPIDRDTDLTNQGLMYPPMGVNSQSQSLFSGQYKIITITNNFTGGKFTQTLNLVRYINSSIIKSFEQQAGDQRDAVSDSVSNSQTNQQDSTSTYNSTNPTAGSNDTIYNTSRDDDYGYGY